MAGLRTSFANKYLDPATSLGELVFGLIMTLTFTLSAGIMPQEEGREGPRQLLIATIGCNVAWEMRRGWHCACRMPYFWRCCSTWATPRRAIQRRSPCVFLLGGVALVLIAIALGG